MYRQCQQQQDQASTEIAMDEKSKLTYIERYLTSEYYLRLIANTSYGGGGGGCDETRLKLINQLSPTGM